MVLYNLFSSRVEVQYKSYLLSKASLFIATITLANIILPFIIAYRSKGFWLKSNYFYEHPTIRSSYDYLLVAETNDPSISIVCGDMSSLPDAGLEFEENCSEAEIVELDNNQDGKNDILKFKFKLNIPSELYIVSLIIFMGLDFQLISTCPLQMQSSATINKDFAVPPNEFTLYGDLQFHQTSHLPCIHNVIDTKYNISLFNYVSDGNKNVVNAILEQTIYRNVNARVTNIYTKSENGHTGTMDINIVLKISEMQIRYKPSFLQELKWAWPQYLSIAVVFYLIFYQIKLFVFNNRLLMSWEVVPWKKKL